MVASMIAWLSGTSARGEDSRRMTLEDCIHAALEKNLDIKIGRYTVTFARLDLDGAYQGWDPVFDIGGDHSFSRRGGGLRHQGRRRDAHYDRAPLYDLHLLFALGDLEFSNAGFLHEVDELFQLAQVH